MKRTVVVIILLAAILIVGCSRGDLKVTPVIAGQAAPHAGYMVGEYLRAGDRVPVSGAVIWIKGLDPNEVFYNDD
ncbi:MAG: hypothetical protein ACYTBZ_27655 [Planctomycetota bacterium]|jgi:hypothetical protein